MKRLLCVFFVLGVLSAALPAQGTGPQGPATPGPRNNFYGERPKTSSLSGVLEAVNGRIALRSDDTLYYVNGLRDLIGFVDGLKEGAQVALEGYVFPVPDTAEYRLFQVTRLTFNQRDYEIRPLGREAGASFIHHRRGPGFGPGMHSGPMMGRPRQRSHWAPPRREQRPRRAGPDTPRFY
jgi:hypothetical protein